ncbi:PREDICTED: uncharacterized protein LOC108551876 [Eufriesea mexicana]|uniref:uncharacterized protein LOC108551876 n=1 Tax=Eufriesea mexicana TaxID=516756 RepID=UPI00083BF2A7|nr:PREDICTED: uncharacterized protein LOC108551876 [Eufriesea mexicana]
MENNVEIKTWREISKNMQGSEYFLGEEGTLFSDLARKKKGIIFLQDSSELGIWKSFRASRNEVVIIDRCGKLTYQIIVPWSILYFPYVKAAILSTYKEDPCGPCYEYSSATLNSMTYEEHRLKTINSDEASIDENVNARTKRIVTDLHTINIQSRRIEDDKNISTTVSFDTNVYERTIYDVTTETSTTLNTETTENKNDNIRDNPFLTDKNIEITTVIPFEQKEIISTMSNFETTEVYEDAQDCTFSKKQIDENNNNSFSTTNDSNIDLPNHDYRDIKSDIILRDIKRKGQEVNENPTQELQIQKDEGIPLRIILYAPHLHEENGTLKTYTHLVLKTRNRDYHDHFHSRSKTLNQEPAVIERSNSMILNDKKLAEYVHTVDESPGIYGEIADYWQTTDKDEFDNKNEDTELTDYDYATAEDIGSSINSLAYDVVRDTSHANQTKRKQHV